MENDYELCTFHFDRKFKCFALTKHDLEFVMEEITILD